MFSSLTEISVERELSVSQIKYRSMCSFLTSLNNNNDNNNN